MVAPVGGGVVGGCEGALQVHGYDRVPVVLRHGEHHPVPQDAGVVDDYVETAPGVDCLLDHLAGRGEVGHVAAVDHCLAAHCLDVVHDLLGRGEVCATAGLVASEVVDDDPCALLGEHQRVLPAYAAACTGDDCDAALTHLAHWVLQNGSTDCPRVPGGMWGSRVGRCYRMWNESRSSDQGERFSGPSSVTRTWFSNLIP